MHEVGAGSTEMQSIPLITWAIWLVLGLLPALIWLAWSRSLRVKRAPASAVGIFIMMGVVSSLFIHSHYARPTPVHVTIASPRSGQEILGHRIRVAGTVAPPGARVALVIRSEKDVRWWVQGVVDAEVQQDGTCEWAVDSRLGTGTEGINENFQIIALGSADGTAFNALTGRIVMKGTRNAALPDWWQSSPTVVRRIE